MLLTGSRSVRDAACSSPSAPHVHIITRDLHDHSLNVDLCSDDDDESCAAASLPFSPVLLLSLCLQLEHIFHLLLWFEGQELYRSANSVHRRRRFAKRSLQLLEYV